MSYAKLRVKIYGSRGSYSPTLAQETSVGINTTCLRIDIGNNIVILDAGSGIINCGKELIPEMQKSGRKQWKVNLLFTHMHIDHLVGFPYFALLYMPQSDIHFLAPDILDYKLEDVLNRFMHPPLFPVGMNDLPFKSTFYQVVEGRTIYFYENSFEISTFGDTPKPGWVGKVDSLRNYMHPKGGSYFYRFETPEGKKFVVASDTEGFVGGDQRLIKFAAGAEVLFHDAQYLPDEYGAFQGFGHSTYQMACDVAQKAGVKKLLLGHHDPRYTDETLLQIEKQASEQFTNTELAREKMEFVL